MIVDLRTEAEVVSTLLRDKWVAAQYRTWDVHLTEGVATREQVLSSCKTWRQKKGKTKSVIGALWAIE